MLTQVSPALQKEDSRGQMVPAKLEGEATTSRHSLPMPEDMQMFKKLSHMVTIL